MYEVRIKTFEYDRISKKFATKEEAVAEYKTWLDNCAEVMVLSIKRPIPCKLKIK